MHFPSRVTMGFVAAASAALIGANLTATAQSGPVSGQPRSAASAQPKPAEFPAYRAPRLGGHPDLNGIWQSFVTANYNIEDHVAKAGPHSELLGAYSGEPAGMSIIEGGVIPYLPAARAKRDQNFKNRLKVDVSDDSKWHDLGDPEAKCYMPGVPRAAYMPFPFQIVQGNSAYMLMAYEYASTTRIVRMDWKGEAPADAWMGWSRGRWDGESLVIDVTGLRAESWLDRSGNYHSDALHVVERYTPLSPYHMQYEATLEDPNVYSRPWKISFPLYRRMEKNAQILEYKCVPFAEQLMFGPFFKKPTDR